MASTVKLDGLPPTRVVRAETGSRLPTIDQGADTVTDVDRTRAHDEEPEIVAAGCHDRGAPPEVLHGQSGQQAGEGITWEVGERRVPEKSRISANSTSRLMDVWCPLAPDAGNRELV